MRKDSTVRLSEAGLKVVRFLMDHLMDDVSGADLTRRTGVGAGTLYPLLRRLEVAGWLDGRWEELEASSAGRPRRRFYKLTSLGFNEGQVRLGALQSFGRAVWV